MDLAGWVRDWPAEFVAAAVVDRDGEVTTTGPTERGFALASVTKLLTAAATHIAHDEGTVDLEAPLDAPLGATMADLLAHSSGLGPDGARLAPPRRRRIYSNAAYERVADQVADGAGFSFAAYLHEAVFVPLGMRSTVLDGSPAAGATSTVEDLVRFVVSVREGQLLSEPAVTRFSTPHLRELSGVLPGYGRQEPNPWAQGAELRGAKNPHWTGATNTTATWGHFGQSGTFLWHDPGPAVSLVVLTDRPFGDWALTRWPELADLVLRHTA